MNRITNVSLQPKDKNLKPQKKRLAALSLISYGFS
jgi:hypothetical protein